MSGFDAVIVKSQIERLELLIESCETFWRSLPEADRRIVSGLSHSTCEYRRQLTYSKLLVDIHCEETPHISI